MKKMCPGTRLSIKHTGKSIALPERTYVYIIQSEVKTTPPSKNPK